MKSIQNKWHSNTLAEHVPVNSKGRLYKKLWKKIMFTIAYKGGGSGCPEGGVCGELVGYNWNSNDFEDDKFPPEGAILDFYAQHKTVEADFFILVVNLFALVVF